MLNMSENRLTRIEGLETLQSLIALNLGMTDCLDVETFSEFELQITMC